MEEWNHASHSEAVYIVYREDLMEAWNHASHSEAVYIVYGKDLMEAWNHVFHWEAGMVHQPNQWWRGEEVSSGRVRRGWLGPCWLQIESWARYVSGS
jgi:hypothetical protein